MREAPARAYALHLGMWIFLGSETLLFAGLFALYASYRAAHPDDFIAAIHRNHAAIGTINTALLISSSFCVAWAIHAMRAGRRRACLVGLAGAMVLGAGFLGLKAAEYASHLADGIAPGYHAGAALPAAGERLFFALYYAMTGLHALHVIAGLAILGWLARRVARARITAERHTELELGGLYWHLVDVVWIFLWPLLYLTG